MKKIILLAFVAVFAFAGCKKDSDSPSNVAGCTINGVKTSFTELYFIESDGYYITNYGDEDESSIEINLSAPIVGDNNFSSSNYIRLEIGQNVYHSYSGEGKITLTKKEQTLIEGTFTGTFTDIDDNEVQISGSFSSAQISLE